MSPGDRLLLLLAGNSPEWVVALWGGLLAGAIVAPGNRWWSAEELAHAPGLVTCSVSDDEEQARREAAAQLAFYAAPRTYHAVLDVAGFADRPTGSGRPSATAITAPWPRPCPTP